VLRPSWSWALAALSFACFGALFIRHVWLPLDNSTHARLMEHVHTHLSGMWIAFGVAAAFIVHFVTRVNRALHESEIELRQASVLAARNEKLASLATLAGGAAHELATPLSTIAVVAKEVERRIERGTSSEDLAADARLIREQVERCREILQQLATWSGEPIGESIEAVDLGELVRSAANGVGNDRVEIVDSTASVDRTVNVPARAVTQALRAVIDNAVRASGPDARVTVKLSAEARRFFIEVVDSGSGMTRDVLDRAGEPFFTTRPPGSGMGLGLFLTRAVIERIGGEVVLDSIEGRGTRALLTLPLGGVAMIDAPATTAGFTEG
jgi:two-component system sensor histidine kinase RegB